MLVIVLMQAEERDTCPYHLSRLEREASVTSILYPQSNIEQSSGSLLTWLDHTDAVDHCSVVSVEPL
jgi:hypothetical protein